MNVRERLSGCGEPVGSARKRFTLPGRIILAAVSVAAVASTTACGGSAAPQTPVSSHPSTETTIPSATTVVPAPSQRTNLPPTTPADSVSSPTSSVAPSLPSSTTTLPSTPAPDTSGSSNLSAVSGAGVAGVIPPGVSAPVTTTGAAPSESFPVSTEPGPPQSIDIATGGDIDARTALTKATYVFALSMAGFDVSKITVETVPNADGTVPLKGDDGARTYATVLPPGSTYRYSVTNNEWCVTVPTSDGQVAKQANGQEFLTVAPGTVNQPC